MKEAFSWTKCGLVLAVIIGMVAIFYAKESELEKRSRMDNVLQSLLIQEKSVNVKIQAKIAVGYGACKDLFVNGKDVIISNPRSELQNFNEIETMEQLLQMYGYFFSHGAAAE